MPTHLGTNPHNHVKHYSCCSLENLYYYLLRTSFVNHALLDKNVSTRDDDLNVRCGQPNNNRTKEITRIEAP